MAASRLELTRVQILAFRRRVQALDERLPPGEDSLRIAAWAGLSDSMPRGALLSIHARVEGTQPSSWEDPSLVQLWGPRFSAYVVDRRDIAPFSLGRLPDDGPARRRAVDLAARLEAFLDGRTMPYRAAGHALGIVPNSLRYAATTGTVLIRWAGAGAPTIRTVPPPDVTPDEARRELARRYLHVFGPGTVDGFHRWAGIKAPWARAAFAELEPSLTPTRSPAGDGWILADDEGAFRAPIGATAPARLLPSGDTFYLLQGTERALLVPDAERRAELWTPRVWPGAVLVEGEVVGTWRRDAHAMSVATWRPLTGAERAAVEAEADGLPLPDLQRRIDVRWER